MNEMIERRKSFRLWKTEPVKITVPEGHTLVGTVQNLSQGGVLVSLAEELELGLTYRIEFLDPEGALSLWGEALRLHLPPSGVDSDEPKMFKVAFEFAGMAESAARRLARMVKDIEA
ncbi:MAG TPA: PilZ domain-containing protein [Candidatus Methylomirabilis sp.]|nr:PilZ domain-containing protein [Candidatus Methylomirabilis sp.]